MTHGALSFWEDMLITIRELEAVRQQSAKVLARGMVTDLRIVKVTGFLDRHSPVRDVEPFFALEYGHGHGPGPCYQVQGAVALTRKFDGFLVSGPLGRGMGMLAPYAIHAHASLRDGNGSIFIGPMAFDGIGHGAMRMAGLVVHSRLYPEAPLIPSGALLEACRVARLEVYEDHQESPGVLCAYSGTAACRGWEKPPPCPRCGHGGTERLPALRGDVDAAVGALRDAGVIYW